jgi:acyl-CoA synthetase (NDP forming)
VDVLVCGITGALGAMTDKLAQDVVQVASEFDKPIIVTWNSLKTDAGFRQLIEAQLPIFRSFRNCFGALRAVFDYGEFLQRYEPLSVDADGIARLQPAPVPGTPTMLDEVASKALLAQYGIPAPREQLARAADEAVGIAGDLGYPVVVKVVSANIAHKSDAGLVRLGLADAAAVRVAVDEVLAAVRQVPGANVAGVLVSEMVKDGHEVILGLARDPQFGMAVMFGLGGVFVEVLKDVTFRVPPFSRAEAQRMLREVKGFALLAGARGAPPADLDALVDGIMALERLSMERPDIEELDVNPLRVLPAGKGARALDALAVIRT